MMLSIEQSYYSEFQTDPLTLTRVMSKLVANFQCHYLQCRHAKIVYLTCVFLCKKKIFGFYKFFDFLLYMGSDPHCCCIATCTARSLYFEL